VIGRVITFGIQAAGCLYAGYWAIFFGSVAFLIITSYLREHRSGTSSLLFLPRRRSMSGKRVENRAGGRSQSGGKSFLEALAQLVGRWLMVRSDAPGMDVVTVLCKAGRTCQVRAS
jgi:hypothetical protein